MHEILSGEKGISTDGHWWLTKEDGWWKNYTAAFEDDLLDEMYRERLLTYGKGEFVMFYGQNDFWYLPSRLGKEFVDIMKVYSQHEVWHETVFQTVIRMLPEEEIVYNIEDGRSKWLWNEAREKYSDWLVPRTYLFREFCTEMLLRIKISFIICYFIIHADPVKLKGQRERLALKEWLLKSKDAWSEASLVL